MTATWIWFNPAAFAVNPNGRFGETLRGEFFGPHRQTVDIGLFKRFTFSSSINLQFRAEFFNLFNTVNFNNPNTTVNRQRHSAGSPRRRIRASCSSV